jgi:hypothetical protein
MTKDEEDYFDRYFDMFASKGWKQWIEELEEAHRNTLARLVKCKTWEDYNATRGEYEYQARILAFEDSITRIYDQRVNDDSV